MQRSARFALAATTVALSVAGCGSSAKPKTTSTPAAASTSNPTTSPARTKVTQAVSRLTSESYRETLSIHTGYDTSGLPASVAGRFAAAPTTITAHGTFESPRRISIVESIPPHLTNLRVVLYDGASFVALDGVHYRRLTGKLAATLGNLSSLSAQGIARYITDVQALGASTVNGQAVDHYGARLDTRGLRTLAGRLTGPLGVNADAIGIDKSKVDIFLDHTSGQVIRLTTVADTTLNLAKLRTTGPAGPKGTLKVHQDVTADITGAGSKITVPRPHTSATSSTGGGATGA